MIRGIDGPSFAKVSNYNEILWWRPMDKPVERDTLGQDPRLQKENRALMERSLANGMSLSRPDVPGGVPKPGVVMGIHVANFSERDGKHGIYFPLKRSVAGSKTSHAGTFSPGLEPWPYCPPYMWWQAST